VLTFDPVGQGERFFLNGNSGIEGWVEEPDSVHCHLGHPMFALGQPLERGEESWLFLLPMIPKLY
jgi:hypothetical protein